jgi:hypothetical protein
VKKRSLAEWASIAEIIGAVAVVVSLLTVAYTVERNTRAISRQGIDELYDGMRELQLQLVADPDLALMVKRGEQDFDFSSLSEKERAQYERYIVIAVDIWDKGIFAEIDGLISEQDMEGWHKFYHNWVRRHMDRKMWDELKWNWESPALSARVEAALAESDSSK